MLRWLTVLGALVAGACVRTSDFPWDAKQLADDVSKEVRFEGVTRPLLQVEPLGWRIDEGLAREPKLPPPPSGRQLLLPELPRPRTDIVLIWARADESTWLVIQVFRHSPEEPWQRSLSYREVVAPLKRLRPGEDPGGTWHAMQRFTNTPTVHELCAFAAVSFLQAPAPSWRTVLRSGISSRGGPSLAASRRAVSLEALTRAPRYETDHP